MSSQPRRAVMCDGEGCPAEVVGRTGADARAVAKSEGWRFPWKVKSDGAPSNRTHDVCPDCYPTFEAPPEQAHSWWRGANEADRKIGAALLFQRYSTEDEHKKHIDALNRDGEVLHACDRGAAPWPSDHPHWGVQWTYRISRRDTCDGCAVVDVSEAVRGDE